MYIVEQFRAYEKKPFYSVIKETEEEAKSLVRFLNETDLTNNTFASYRKLEEA